jgi:hypothetical protein
MILHPCSHALDGICISRKANLANSIYGAFVADKDSTLYIIQPMRDHVAVKSSSNSQGDVRYG